MRGRGPASAFGATIAICVGLFAGCAEELTGTDLVAVEVVSANAVRVGGQVFPLDQLERALQSTASAPPYRVEIVSEVEAGDFGEVWDLYGALFELHEEGLVDSISTDILRDEDVAPPIGRFSREIPRKSACVRVTADGVIAVGQAFEAGARVSSLEELVERARKRKELGPSRPFIVEADEASPADLVERVQVALREAGVEQVYLLAAQDESTRQQICRFVRAEGPQ